MPRSQPSKLPNIEDLIMLVMMIIGIIIVIRTILIAITQSQPPMIPKPVVVVMPKPICLIAP